MSHESNNSLLMQSMNKSILNHLFLPCYLPSSAEDDFLIQNDCKEEYRLLECMKEYLESCVTNGETNGLQIFSILIGCVKHWSSLQNPSKCSKLTIQSTIQQLLPESFLPLYFHAQNAAILIEIEESKVNQPLISSWQVLLPNEEITSSFAPHLSCFPTTMYRLQDRSELASIVNCELLNDFMTNTIERPISIKDSDKVPETRDVSIPHYICQWWIQHFREIKVENNLNESLKFKKKHRDHIRYHDAKIPFRRSGLWMTMKVVFQTILMKRLKGIGTVVYKLLITDFLMHVVSAMKLSTELLVHCIRKIVRRLSKIEKSLSYINVNDEDKWIQNTKQKLRTKINEVFPKPDWQKVIQERESRNCVRTEIEENNANNFRHSCSSLKDYLKNQTVKKRQEPSSIPQSHDDGARVNQADYIPFLTILRNEFHYTDNIALIRMEIWVESCLDQWMNRQISENEENRFQILSRFSEDYQNVALNLYCPKKTRTNPIGYSRFILTSLTIIRSMHRTLCNDQRFKSIGQHSIHISNLMDLFKFLILPTREDMIRARKLYQYFHEFSNKRFPDVLTDIQSGNAFGVLFAKRTLTMMNNIQEIRVQAEEDKQRKIQEVNEAQKRYMDLMHKLDEYECVCNNHHYPVYCRRCAIQEETEKITVSIYECPIPSTDVGALAVIFELQMPIEIRCYRDILWQFVNRPNPNPKNDFDDWLQVNPHKAKLKRFYTGPDNRKVRLVSDRKTKTESHYRNPPISTSSIDDFVYENRLEVRITPTVPINFEDERRVLTPQLDDSVYKELQFTIDSTEFVQNDVIAKLLERPKRHKSTHFVEFGSFRSGHRLQWWNLLTILEMNSLSIAEENVAILIIHSILQYGPFPADSDTFFHPWCPESHQQLPEDHFVEQLLPRLHRYLDDYELNWQNELVLVVITMITMRILTICNATKTNDVAKLAIKCRTTGEKWIYLILEYIQTISSSAYDEAIKLRLKVITIGISCVLTFSGLPNQMNLLLSSDEHIISLLRVTKIIRDNFPNNQPTMSAILTYLLTFGRSVLVMVQPNLAKLLQEQSYRSLHAFAANYYGLFGPKNTTDRKWNKRKKDQYDGWYDCRHGSANISIDCVRGIFLVNDEIIDCLPEEITSNKSFIRVFGQTIFEVQATEAPTNYITKDLDRGHIKLRYKFHFNRENKNLTIIEEHKSTNETFQLIPASYLEADLPDTFVSNHSHWWNVKNRTISFRPIHFKEPDFLDAIPYILSLETGCVTTTETNNKQTLINQSSPFFQKLFLCYFIRLDDLPYVYMMQSNGDYGDTIIHIHLSRLRLAFQYNTKNSIVTSCEYPEMRIADDQWLGTLTGLRSGLLLSPLAKNNQMLQHYPYRKLIVPFGEIHSEEFMDNHQVITIQRSSSMEFSDRYFVFILNGRLKTLQSIESPSGWLYLALLHAMTSNPLPDEYTGMTGMERAFQLLNSAGSWSDQPYDALSLDLLRQIAAISPKVAYYPEHRNCMEKIDWNFNNIPYSMQHFGYYIIAKRLIETSQRLNFMYSSSIPNKIPTPPKDESSDEKLLKKLYWDYRHSYTPLARLTREMEMDNQCADEKPYRSYSIYLPNRTSYDCRTLVGDLYSMGDVDLKDCSNHDWLPLCQWLKPENGLKNIWVSLLKLVILLKRASARTQSDNIERFKILLDFLRYINDKSTNEPFYLQILKTILEGTQLSLSLAEFPSFIAYKNIDQITLNERRINFLIRFRRNDQSRIKEAIRKCWDEKCDYQNVGHRVAKREADDINELFASWRSNRALRLFLNKVDACIPFNSMKKFAQNISPKNQVFEREPIKNCYRLEIKPSKKLIDPKLLLNADQKFRHHYYYDHFQKPSVSCQASNRSNEFPDEIFSSFDDSNDSLSQIRNYFRNQLCESWNKFLSEKHTQKENPSEIEIREYLQNLQEESEQSWRELEESIIESNRQLFKVGLVSRITPTTLIPLLQQNKGEFQLTPDQYTLLGGIIVNWTLEQQLERALHFAVNEKREDFEKEISNVPHRNWVPSEHVSWLILELEMNVTIRENQVNVALHMMQGNMITNDSKEKNMVMQMNMGEGKTSVILPMLALQLSSSSCLVRIVVLKSLSSTNYQSLRYKLGGLLNRRVFLFVCCREMNFNNQKIQQIDKRLKEGLDSYDVVLTTPEDILSFDLLIIDKFRREEIDVGSSMLTIQKWLKTNARDILDESDEILHVKYQLIYTISRQKDVEGDAERWESIQLVLELVKNYAENISKTFDNDVFYKPGERQSAFPQFRLQSRKPFPLLREKISNDWIDRRNYQDNDKKIILSFILEPNLSIESLNNKFPANDLQLFLVLRGLLSSEILLDALKKRYRVNYGINQNANSKRLMAIPYRAKDVAADRVEFGHPDIAILLTQLSYYYSGLNDSQLTECFDHLIEKESDPQLIYEEWILYEKDHIPPSIKQWKGINLKNDQQKMTHLFPTFRYSMVVINYFLNHSVFPREAKQFPHNIVSSAWDLSFSTQSSIVTGFSGTNDTQLLLPIHIHQCDLPELQKTDAIVLNNLLQPENESYEHLAITTTSQDFLKQIVEYEKSINVILDVGALFTDKTNQEIAVKWLSLSDKSKIDYAVYLDLDTIVASDRQKHHYRFETSPASERLDRCVFYLDEIHTRGTDFKFPTNFRGAVTLGNGLTKDRFVQACMRMRKLGKGHSLTFWSSHEVHQQIKELKTNSYRENQTNNAVFDSIKLFDILRWVYMNTVESTWDGLHHWATQSLYFQKKIIAFRRISEKDDKQEFLKKTIKKFVKECLEKEVNDLESMYGAPRLFQTIFDIHTARYQKIPDVAHTVIRDKVLERLKNYGGTKVRLSHLLNEEQQREVQQEPEKERQSEPPLSATPCKPILHEEIGRLCDENSSMLDLSKFRNIFQPLVNAFVGTTFFNQCQSDDWEQNLWISTEFQRVIETNEESLDPLRPPRWVIFYRNKHIIFISAYEANEVIARLRFNKSLITTLRLLLPRTKRYQSILINEPALTIPPFIKSSNNTVVNFVPVPTEWLVQLFVFNGTLYFEKAQEQTAYCQYLALCPEPRTKKEQDVFKKGGISASGFVAESEYRKLLFMDRVRFQSDPVELVKQIIKSRNDAHLNKKSHVGSIILISSKNDDFQ